jgi:hypothetical protein
MCSSCSKWCRARRWDKAYSVRSRDLLARRGYELTDALRKPNRHLLRPIMGCRHLRRRRRMFARYHSAVHLPLHRRSPMRPPRLRVAPEHRNLLGHLHLAILRTAGAVLRTHQLLTAAPRSTPERRLPLRRALPREDREAHRRPRAVHQPRPHRSKRGFGPRASSERGPQAPSGERRARSAWEPR